MKKQTWTKMKCLSKIDSRHVRKIINIYFNKAIITTPVKKIMKTLPAVNLVNSGFCWNYNAKLFSNSKFNIIFYYKNYDKLASFYELRERQLPVL